MSKEIENISKKIEIGKRIKQRRLELELTQEELGKRLALNKSTIQRYESGAISSIKLPVLQAIAKHLNVNPDWLALKTDTITEYTQHTIDIFNFSDIIPIPETKEIPLLGAIACGEPILAEENIEDYVKLDKTINAEFALRCKGDSMIGARIRSGDIVYIHQQPDVENGEIAAVLIGEEATLKKVYKYPEKEMLVLKAANPDYEDFIFTGAELESVRILGKAVGFYSNI